ncbi:MAG: EamA family transporter [Lachnospiraceae bacterium]|nr:EamA family transporter [Lachnospiraceae bacterium]
MWMIAAIGSAVFAGLTAILAKCGIRKTNSDVATALRTIVVLLFSILMVFLVGSQGAIEQISAKSWVFLVLSGLATGASWICCFRALSLGDVNKVAPIDKSSTVLSVLLAILIFREHNNLIIKLIGTAMIGTGTFLMIERKNGGNESGDSKWFGYAILSAVFAALTSVLAKAGISGVESNLATAIRTVVILMMAWLIVFARGEGKLVREVDRKELLFIGFSGLATGASWLCYYYAIQNGSLSVVIPIDKMSILVTVLFSWIFLKEKLSLKVAAGLVLMCAGTLAMAVWA